MTSIYLSLLTFVTLTVVVAHAQVPIEHLEKEELLHRVKRQADASCETADIVFVLDSSGSIGTENWDRVLNFTKSILIEFPIGPEFVQIGVNYYGNKANLAFHLNDHGTLDDVLDAVDAIPWLDQNTNTSGGIRLMHRDMFKEENGARATAPWIGIVITDGESTFDKELTIPEADIARTQGIILFAIGIGEATSQEELEGIADDPDSKFVFNADSFAALGAIKEAVVETTCGVAAECRETGDLVLILDSSGSVGEPNFNAMIGFVDNMIREALIDEGDTRIGLMTYSTNARVEWHLDASTTRANMSGELQKVRYQSGTTNTAEALRVARTTMFTPGNGDRAGQRNMLVLFTDGGSNDFVATLDEARLTRLAGIKVFVVAISNWVNSVEIREIASDPDVSNTFSVLKFEDILSIYQPLKRTLCNDVDECSGSKCINGGTCINEINDYTCICPTGFAGKNCHIACPNPADVVLILDGSTSMGSKNYYELQDYAKHLIQHLNLEANEEGQSVGLITFGDAAVQRMTLKDYHSKRTMIDAISYPFQQSTTNSGDALRMLVEDAFTIPNGDHSTVRNIGLIFTDGASTDRQEAFLRAANAHSQDISILAVGVDVKGKFSRKELMAFASDPDALNFVEVQTPSELYAHTDFFVKTICDDVDECLSSPCHPSATCVNRLNSYECQCPTGRSGLNCERTCDGELDIAFVIDASGSIHEDRFQIVLDFISDIITNLEVRPGRTHVSAVTFADSASFRFPFDAYQTKEDIIQAIQYFDYSRGRTNTADALRMLYSQVFIPQNGDRPAVPNLAFVVTDGSSTLNQADTIPAAIDARMNGIHVIVGSVENSLSNLELRGIADRPAAENIFNVDRFADLGTIVDTLVMAACDDTNECDSVPCGPGTCFNELHRYRCQCPSSRTGKNCQRACTRRYDAALLLDASGSMDDFELVQDIARYIVMGLNFQSDRTRLGVITYQDTATVRFKLNSYTSQIEVENAVAFNNNPGIVGTNTASALRIMQSDFFTAIDGDRNGETNVAIVVSDGRSNREAANTGVEADNARADGVRVMSIGVGNNVNVAELDRVADFPPSENVFYVPDAAGMEAGVDALLDLLCQ